MTSASESASDPPSNVPVMGSHTGAVAIVTDRLAISACLQRVNADLTAPATALIYKGIAVDAMGKLDPASAPAKAAAAMATTSVV